MSKTYSNLSKIQLRNEKERLLDELVYFSGKLNEAEEQAKKIVDRDAYLTDLQLKIEKEENVYSKVVSSIEEKNGELEKLKEENLVAKDKLKIVEELLNNVSCNGEQEVQRYKNLISNLETKLSQIKETVEEKQPLLDSIVKQIQTEQDLLNDLTSQNIVLEQNILELNEAIKVLRDEETEITARINDSQNELSMVIEWVQTAKKDLETITTKKVETELEIQKLDKKHREQCLLREEEINEREGLLIRRENLMEGKRKELIEIKNGLEKYHNKPILMNI